MHLTANRPQTQRKSQGSYPRPPRHFPAIATDRDLAPDYARLCIAGATAGIDLIQGIYAGHLAAPIGPGVDLAISAGIKAATFAAEDQVVIWCAATDSRHGSIGEALLLAARRLVRGQWWDAGEPHFRRGPLWSVASLIDLSAQHPGPVGVVPALARRLIELRTRQEKAVIHFDYAKSLIEQIGAAA